MDAIVISKFILLSTILASASTIISSNNTTPFGHFITHQASLEADKQQKQFAVLHAQLLKQQSFPKFKPNLKSKNNPQILELPKPLKLRNYDYDYEDNENATVFSISKKNDEPRRLKHKSSSGSFDSRLNAALNIAAKQGLDAMVRLYEKTEPEMLRKGEFLDASHPGAQLSRFSEAIDGTENNAKAAYAALIATKHFQKTYKLQSDDFGRQAPPPKVSFRRTPLEGLCPPRDQPRCLPAAQRYRTHDGSCNNMKRLRWGASLLPFNRFLSPEYGDGIDTIRGSLDGGPLPSARFVSLLVHGSRESEAPVTLMTAQWGQLVDHDLTSTAQPRSVNGSVPRCCGSDDFHPSCLPIKVPLDDPWLAPLKVRCLEFLRSAPAQRRDCVLSWREQTNQATSYLDASPVYSSSARTSDNARVFRNGLLQFGRGNPQEDVCLRGALSGSCIRPGDGRSGEQPGLLAMHHVWVGEHNRIALELNELNPHWSDEKVYQEARRIVGALFQHITFREFLPLVVGREVSKLFELELLNSGYYEGYDPDVNPTVANSFGAAAFRFGHSLIQGTYMRCDKNHNFLDNNVALHNENINGDVESAGSLHRLLRGLAAQKAQMRDEFITAELTNHLFQSGTFPFGLDLAAINIQRGRDHGIPPYTSWREPCGLSPIRTWQDLEKIVGPASTKRIGHAYRSVHDIDLFVGGISERPVIGGLVGPTFACIIAQQFSNLRKGDRFWYENSGFENSFTPAQLHSIRRVSLSQIMCRALGGGTLQPHIFLPHDLPENERLPCGIDILAPIDLLPWLEEDPFKERRPLPKPPVQSVFSEDTVHSSPITPIFDRIDFLLNGSTGLPKPTFVDLQPNKRDNTSMEVSDKLDIQFPPKFTSTIPPRRISIPHKVDTKKRKPTPTPFPHKKGHEFTTRRTVIINNIPVILRRSADPFSKETFDTDLETRSQDIELMKTDETTGRKGHDTIFVQINRYNTTKNETINDKPERRLENEETIYGTYSGQKALKRHPDAEEYEIEINIRQTNNRRHHTNYYPNDYNSKFDDRNSVSTPFSYKPISSGPSSDQFNYRPLTKPPKVIYIDDQDDYITTTTPGLLQTFFMVGTNGIIDHLQRPVSFLQNNLFGSGSNSGSNSGLTSGSPAPISSSNFGGSLNSPASSSATSSSSTSNIFNINIRPSGPTSDLSDISPSLPPPSGSYGLHTASRRPSPLNYDKPSNPFSSGYPISDASSFQGAPHHDYDRFQYLSTTTRRPYYQPTHSYFPRNKDASFLTVHDQNITSPPAEILPQPFNYRLTTFSSILPSTDNTSKTVDYDDENGDTDMASKFDKDGYLRPEHMLLKILSHRTNDSLTTTDNSYNTTLMSRDDFVLPALLDTETSLKATKQNETTHLDAIPRRPATEILAEDYDEISIPKPLRHDSDKSSNLAPFAPLNVLTKPERPDKWVIVDVPKGHSPLPEPPSLDTGNTATIEYPKPIMVRIRSISNRKFGQRLRGPP